MTLGPLSDLAKEALKPTSSVVDALLAPKLSRLRSWAAERDLRTRITPARLDDLFRPYLRSLLRRASGLNTIVFPQQVLALPTIYEPLLLLERHSRRSVAQSDLVTNGAHTYIVDGAGMGKSTFVKHLVLEVLTTRDSIPLLLELRKVQEGETLLAALGREFDALDKQFSRDVLHRLIAHGNFLIVLDGFDEVPSTNRAALARDIEDLASKSEAAAVVLTARPEVELPAMPGGRALEFEPLSRDQAVSLVRRFDEAGDIDVGERLVREFDVAPERFLQIPLLVSLLYRTYGFNGSISMRVSTFYDEIYSALYKGHDLSKAGFAREKASGLDVEDFRRLLRAFAFLLIARQTESFVNRSRAIEFIDDAERLCSVHPSSSSAFLEDLLLPVPLMVREGQELRFIHKTIAEYFAADFLAGAPNADEILRNIQQGPLRRTFNEVLEFLADTEPPLFRRTVGAQLASATLAHSPAEDDSLMRSLSFCGNVKLSLWPEKEVDAEADRGMDIQGPLGPSRGFWLFYGTIDTEPYILAVTDVELEACPAAWALITKSAYKGPYRHSGYRFDGLIPALPLGEWIGSDDACVLAISSSRHLERSF